MYTSPIVWYPPMHRFVTEMCTFSVTKWRIVGYLMHCGICKMGQLHQFMGIAIFYGGYVYIYIYIYIYIINRRYISTLSLTVYLCITWDAPRTRQLLALCVGQWVCWAVVMLRHTNIVWQRMMTLNVIACMIIHVRTKMLKWFMYSL